MDEYRRSQIANAESLGPTICRKNREPYMAVVARKKPNIPYRAGEAGEQYLHRGLQYIGKLGIGL